MEYRLVAVISGKGPGSDQFSEALNGLAVDKAGLIHAVGDREVKVFDSDGKLRGHWPTDRPGYCVAIDDAATVYVGEAQQIEKFDSLGNHLTTWRDAARLGVVTAIGFFGEFVLAADAKDRCIRSFDRKANWLIDIGKDNNTKGFMIPNGYLDFSVDAKGVIHAANPAKHRVERYTMSGELLGYFGKFGTHNPEDFPGCCNPTNLTLTREGNVVVTEKAGPRMKVYDTAGTEPRALARAVSPSTEPRALARADSPKLIALIGPEFFDPNCKNMDVAVDLKGRIYVADTVRLTINVFAPETTENERVGAAVTSTTPGGGEA